MKTISTLLIVLLATGFAFSQSFQLVGYGTPGVTDTMVCGNAGDLLTAVAVVKNVSGSTKSSILCRRQIISMVTGNYNKFCWGTQCGSPTTDVSATSVNLAPNATSNTFVGYLGDVSMSLINDTVRYIVFDSTNVNDSLSWVVVYCFSTGVNEVIPTAKNTLVNAFPDPSDNASLINYTLAKDAKTAKINIMNMIGNKVAEYQIDTKDSKFNIPTKNLNAGIYFYSLEVDGRVTSTKKLMVNH